MTDSSECGRQCVDHLLDEMNRLFTRFEQEYDITVVELLGCLEAMKHNVLLSVTDDDQAG